MPVYVMVNGMPGEMGRMVGEVVADRGLHLVPYSLTGEDVSLESVTIRDTVVQLVKPSQRNALVAKMHADFPQLVMVDYTHPSAVNGNAEFYVKNGFPFVMGTTGGDRQALMELVNSSKHPCVIAPNMSKQIVAFQALMEMLSTEFPDAFQGYQLSIVESHQKTKADVSGTAKAVAGSFRKMGFDFADSEIQMVRTENEQLERMKVPETALSGHAFHTYSLDSKDGSVHFEFQHNICGRKVYAEGTVDAVVFLATQIREGKKPRCWNMMDILRAGAMRTT